MRGKEISGFLDLLVEGITPAYAGKSFRTCAVQSRDRDHPRVCGEKCGYRLPFRSIVGSPPRVRGKGADHLRSEVCLGVTPACAGKSCAEQARRFHLRDHPRVCGEKVPITCVPKYALGSPPRVRGKVCWRERHRPVPGITPACAGKSGRTSGLTRPARDHPRVCGEKCARWKTSIKGWGSPPRVRGKVPSSI